MAGSAHLHRCARCGSTFSGSQGLPSLTPTASEWTALKASEEARLARDVKDKNGEARSARWRRTRKPSLRGHMRTLHRGGSHPLPSLVRPRQLVKPSCTGRSEQSLTSWPGESCVCLRGVCRGHRRTVGVESDVTGARMRRPYFYCGWDLYFVEDRATGELRRRTPAEVEHLRNKCASLRPPASRRRTLLSVLTSLSSPFCPPTALSLSLSASSTALCQHNHRARRCTVADRDLRRRREHGLSCIERAGAEPSPPESIVQSECAIRELAAARPRWAGPTTSLSYSEQHRQTW